MIHNIILEKEDIQTVRVTKDSPNIAIHTPNMDIIFQRDALYEFIQDLKKIDYDLFR